MKLRTQNLVTITAVLAMSAVFSACGSESNINRMWGSDDDAADSTFIEAKAAYDKGDFRRAEDLLEKLVGRNADNEPAVVLLGYTYLSKGGIDPFTLARKLITLSADTTSTVAATKASASAMLVSAAQDLETARQAFLADGAGDLAGTGSTAATGSSATATASKDASASSTLLKLSSIINLTAADFAKLGTNKFVGKSSLFAAADTSIIVPNEVDDALRNSVDVLLYMNKAVKSICRFVDDSTKVEGDSRDTDASCAQTTVARPDAAKAHFLWAFSHLTEAMVFQSVLLYNTGTSGVSNFETASTEINNFQGSGTDGGLSEFVNKVSDVKGAVDAVFDFNSANSMISTTLRDILAVNQAFTALSGLPASITKPITDALAKLNSVAKEVSGSETDVTGQTKALKGQMVQKFSQVIGAKIGAVTTEQIKNAKLPGVTSIDSKADFEKVAASDQLTAPQKSKVADLNTKLYGDPNVSGDKGLCGAYDTLSDGLSAETAAASKPGPCK